MRQTCFYLLAALGLIVTELPAAAQSPMTESEFLAALREDHPAFIAATEGLAIAEGARRAAGRLENPRVGADWELPEDATRQSTWSLAWTPPLDGRRGLRVRASEAALGAARANVELAQLETRIACRAIFAEWALAAERRVMTASHLERVRALVARMSARAESGEESGLSARRVELAAIEIEAMLALADAAEASARTRAAAWNPDAANSAPERPSLPEILPSLDASANTGIRALELDLEAAAYDARLSRRFLSAPDLMAGWQRQQADDAPTFEGPVFGVSWPLPLFDRQSGERAMTARRLESSTARLAFLRTQSAARIDAARAAYDRLREGASTALTASDDTQRLVESASASFALGESSLTDLLDTLRSVLTTRLTALDLYGAALEAHRELEAAAGRTLTTIGGGK
ncbi:MAG: TolC family protein [bacterium]